MDDQVGESLLLDLALTLAVLPVFERRGHRAERLVDVKEVVEGIVGVLVVLAPHLLPLDHVSDRHAVFGRANASDRNRKPRHLLPPHFASSSAAARAIASRTLPLDRTKRSSAS